tara:strand:- start:379 stop:765 length:387 start_codon:yes stop_codon:yes gene_type:complete
MKSILESHSVATLKKEISKSNVKGYSKMKKAEIIELMMEHKEKFSHIKMAEKKERKKPEKKEEKKPEEKETHEMPDGAIHTGETHTKDSKVVKKAPKKKVKFNVKKQKKAMTITKSDGSVKELKYKSK